jgi:hypothetical protein
MEARQMEHPIQCVECSRIWLATDVDRWRAYWLEDAREAQLVFYCPACAEREFPTG